MPSNLSPVVICFLIAGGEMMSSKHGEGKLAKCGVFRYIATQLSLTLVRAILFLFISFSLPSLNVFPSQMDHLPLWASPTKAAGAGFGQGTSEIIEYIGTIDPGNFTGPYNHMVRCPPHHTPHTTPQQCMLFQSRLWLTLFLFRFCSNNRIQTFWRHFSPSP